MEINNEEMVVVLAALGISSAVIKHPAVIETIMKVDREAAMITLSSTLILASKSDVIRKLVSNIGEGVEDLGNS